MSSLVKINKIKLITNNYLVNNDINGIKNSISEYIKILNSATNKTIIGILQNEIVQLYNYLGLALDKNNCKYYLDKALEIDPNNAITFNNYAHVYITTENNYKMAEELYKKAIASNPNFKEPYFGIIQVYKQTKNKEKEIEYINLGIKNNPNEADLFNFKGVYEFEICKIKDSLVTFNQGLEFCKDKPVIKTKIVMNIGHVKSCMGLVEEAIDYYLDSIKIDPTHELAYHNILLNLLYIDENKINLVNRFPLIKKLGNNISEIHAKVYKILSNLHTRNNSIQIHKYRCCAQKIRIGFVSSDFVDHAVSIFIDAIFRHYNTDEFELYLYSNKYYSDEVVKSIGNNLNFRHVQNFSNDKIVEIILNDGIQKLIDLSGYTSGNRMDVFNLLASLNETNQNQNKYQNKYPKLLTFLGYPHNLYIPGLVRISDEFTEMEDPDSKTETVLMPRLFLCFTPKIVEIKITKQYIKDFENYLILGTFSKIQKINDDVVQAWNRVFEELDRLSIPFKFVVKSKYLNNTDEKEKFANRFYNKGSNLLFIDNTTLYIEHLQLFNLLDLSLDTFPYSGTTITNESLFMNVPVITMSKGKHVSRVSGSILTCMGFNDLVTYNVDDYVNKIVDFAKSDYKSLRSSMDVHRRFVDVMDPKKYTREFEELMKT